MRVSAPSNIALIKYMGKTETSSNQPTNTSLSLSLPHLKTWVELEKLPATAAAVDVWEPLGGFENPGLSPAAEERFLRHAQLVKQKLGMQDRFVIRSANDFPGDCGLASSASSFAALTKALHQWSVENGGQTLATTDLAQLSRQGSGSSCRSFFDRWALWSPETVNAVDLPLAPLHQVVVVQSEKKAVSSSEAHRRVPSSDLFAGRPARAEARCRELLAALGRMDWKRIYEICWIEFQDMHALFETSQPPFGYFEPGSVEVLRAVREVWHTQNDGPIVTMDAGPNVHVLWRPDQAFQARVFAATWKVRHRVISSPLENL